MTISLIDLSYGKPQRKFCQSPFTGIMVSVRIRPATAADLSSLRALLLEANETSLPIGAVVREKCFDEGFGGEARAIVADEGGTLTGVAVTCGSALRLIAVAPEERRRGVGSQLMREILEESRARKRLVVGAAPGNYLVPGVPLSASETIRFLRNRGFERIGEATDMTVELGSVPDPPRVHRLARAEDHPRLLAFVRDFFGESLGWEIELGIRRNSLIRIAVREEKVVGFSACEINNRGIGSFGPQGIHPDSRRRGLGRELLLESLGDLRELGYTTARIPWVSSEEYYERSCGARVVERFVTLARGETVHSS
jgi:mycothiol synthase